MTNENKILTILSELEQGMQLTKCQKCGCMRETLDSLDSMLPKIGSDEALNLHQKVEAWVGQMQPMSYGCLGCDHCYPAIAQNALFSAFPAINNSMTMSCDFQIREQDWPPIVGEYFMLDNSAPVAVATLASVQLAEDLAGRKIQGLAIVGKTETENIGIDKVIKNIITNPAIRYLIVAGADPKGHQSGKTLIALGKNGVDLDGHVIDSPGKRPVLRNVTSEEIRLFRKQVEIIDMIGCISPKEIVLRVEELFQYMTTLYNHNEYVEESLPNPISTAPFLNAAEPEKAVIMDKAGYFVIIPLVDKGVINVEHYDYDNTLLRVIEGTNARAIYTTITTHDWVTELSHAAYLGKELAKAELSLQLGIKYIQDGA
jgi:tetrahydromethanopterin S-methyltransferase subunit A